MRDPSTGQPQQPNQPQPSQLPPEVFQQLATAWLGTFQGLARAQDGDRFKLLFHPDAIIFGCEKGGVCDWPLRLQFTFDLEAARIVPAYSLVICDWSMEPLIVGGGKRQGHATFMLMVEPAGVTDKGKPRKGAVLCVHAHFSALAQ